MFLRSGFEHLRFCSVLLLRHIAQAWRYLGMILGAGGLPRRLDFSCVCAGRVPIAPAVGAVLPYLCLVPWWRRVWCDACVVSWLDACTASLDERLLFAAHAALSGWRFLCVRAFGGFLLYFLVADACLTITSLCTT